VKGAYLYIKITVGRMTNFDVADLHVMELTQYFSKYEFALQI